MKIICQKYLQISIAMVGKENDSCTVFISLLLRGLSLRSKPELLQVLELRNRRREGVENCMEPTPLEREFLRWQQRREQVRLGYLLWL